jgi:hypothetical protein
MYTKFQRSYIGVITDTHTGSKIPFSPSTLKYHLSFRELFKMMSQKGIALYAIFL